MREAGFEPAHPEIVGLKSTALDHSAIRACKNARCGAHKTHQPFLGLLHPHYNVAFRLNCYYEKKYIYFFHNVR